MVYRRVTPWVLASLLAGCLPTAQPLRCDLGAGDRACDSVFGARCVQGYCAEPVAATVCASGLRYTASAARPGQCVSEVDAGVSSDIGSGDARVASDIVNPEDRVSSDIGSVEDRVSSDIVDAGGAGVDAPTVIDGPTARDVPAAFDAGGRPRAEILAPLANARYLSGAVSVRIARRAVDRVFVRAVAGNDCTGAGNLTEVTGSSVTLMFMAGYHCLRLEGPPDGPEWSSPWRHIVSMGRSYGDDRVAFSGHWPDFNNDGRADLLMITRAVPDTQVRVFAYSATGAISAATTVLGPTQMHTPVAVAAVGDVDGDAFGDAVISWGFGGRREVWIHRGSADGLRGPSTRVDSEAVGSNTEPFATRIFSYGDRGRDGRANFGVLGVGASVVRGYGLNADGLVTTSTTYEGQGPIEEFVSDADVDGDPNGDPDAAFTIGATVFLSLSSLTNNIEVPRGPGADTSFGRRLVMGSDLDNDGRSELGVLSAGTGQIIAYKFARTSISEVARISLPAGASPELAMVGDMNRDLVDDLVAFAGASSIRLYRTGFASPIDGMLAWRAPLGVLVAGAGDGDYQGRVWGGGTIITAPEGFVVYGFDGSALTSTVVPETRSGRVIAVAP